MIHKTRILCFSLVLVILHVRLFITLGRCKKIKPVSVGMFCDSVDSPGVVENYSTGTVFFSGI